MNKKTAFGIALLLLITTFGWERSYSHSVEKHIDDMLSNQFLENEPGVIALVAKEGKIIYHKAFGLANVELNVNMEPDMVFKIGSITKQFTAVSILMLVEQGKLSLDDTITKFIPDYPLHGNYITIHHLLTHTSGIKSYTSMASWPSVWKRDFEPTEMIDFFKSEPTDFAPGERRKYNNSGYFILGYIIEKVSGITYGEFIEKNIFKRLGMYSSLYGNNTSIIIKRVNGYEKEEEQLVNARYLSLTQPYAAGALMSTVNDLFIWNRAIVSNKLIKKETIKKAFTNYKLNDGTPTYYGYGWGFSNINGSPTIEHPGGIFGYLSNSIYLPNEDVFVAVFSNCYCNNPIQISTKIAALAIEKPYPSSNDIIKIKDEDLKKFEGLYEFDDNSIRIISFENNQLQIYERGGEIFNLFPFKKGSFFMENSLSTIQFTKSDSIMNAILSGRTSKITGIKTEKPFPIHKEIQIDNKVLKQYIGEYVFDPEYSVTIYLEDDKLVLKATGQEKLIIYPESLTVFFSREVDSQIEFIKNEKDSYDSIILYEGEEKFIGKRKK